MSGGVTLVSRIPELIASSEAKASAAVEKATFDIEAGAKRRLVEQGAVDTGNLMNSIQGEMHDALSGEVSVGAFYGIYVEGGTVHPPRHTSNGGVTRAYTIAARPYFAPAIEEAREPFEMAVGQIYR